MNSSFYIILLTIISIGEISGRPSGAQPEPQAELKRFVYYGSYDSCEGKDAANYSLIGEGNHQLGNCELLDLENAQNQLVQSPGNGQRSTISLQLISRSQLPAGAFQQVESLWLATGGPLQGRYIFERVVYLSVAYLKKCSSLLGYSYISTKSAVLLISDKLDLNVLIAPNGGFETFKKGCTTVCNGRAYLF